MLELKNISAGYGRKSVVSDINLSFEKGSVTSIIGPNGSGKTTVLKAAAGLIPVSSGEVILDGKNIADYDRKDIAKRISFLPQIKSVSSISVRSLALHGRFPYLSWPRRYSADDRRIAEEALQSAGVADIADMMINELSGGQQQRAYLAMLLAQQTDIIFLDEPASYLDINAQFELEELVNRLKSLGRTIVMISHNLSDALTNSDYIAVISNGKLTGFGKADILAENGAIESAFGVKPLFSKDSGQYYFRKQA